MEYGYGYPEGAAHKDGGDAPVRTLETELEESKRLYFLATKARGAAEREVTRLKERNAYLEAAVTMQFPQAAAAHAELTRLRALVAEFSAQVEADQTHPVNGLVDGPLR